MARGVGADDPSTDPQWRDVLVTNSRRGLRLQVAVRFVLVAFLLGTAVFVAPARHNAAMWTVVVVYAVVAVGINGWLFRGGPTAVDHGWAALFVDLVALGAATLVAGNAAVESWTADTVINGFFVVPLLAATQLRPLVCTAIVVPTEAAYLLASVATRQANAEPLASVLMRAAALAALCAGCVALSAIQRARVMTIGSLAASRARLLADLLDLEGRERQRLSEHLHDGALQFVLAARMDLDDLRDGTDPAALDRMDTALNQTSALLRSTVGELYPAVLAQAGLPTALRELAAGTAERGGFAASFDDAGWTDGRTSADALLFTTARELLANVVKHAHADHVVLTVAHDGERARLDVRDDGTGIPDGELERKLRAGHIGVASHRARVEAAGGRMTYRPDGTRGTVATVTVPARALPPPEVDRTSGSS